MELFMMAQGTCTSNVCTSSYQDDDMHMHSCMHALSISDVYMYYTTIIHVLNIFTC